jgi:hypothetical protein
MVTVLIVVIVRSVPMVTVLSVVIVRSVPMVTVLSVVIGRSVPMVTAPIVGTEADLVLAVGSRADTETTAAEWIGRSAQLVRIFQTMSPARNWTRPSAGICGPLH